MLWRAWPWQQMPVDYKFKFQKKVKSKNLNNNKCAPGVELLFHFFIVHSATEDFSVSV